MTRTQHRPTGSDTREAISDRVVKLTMLAAMTSAGIGWFAALAAPSIVEQRIELPTRTTLWIAVLLVTIGAGVAIGISRPSAGGRAQATRSSDFWSVAPSIAMAILGSATAATSDWALATMSVAVLPGLSGWAVGISARSAVRAVPRHARSAAAGLIAAAAIAGTLLAVQIWTSAQRSGMTSGAGWIAAYSLLSSGSALAAARRLRHRIRSQSYEKPVIPSGAALTLARIDISFRHQQVLKAADLVANKSELLALVGGNGSGKSTLLRVAAGFLAPDGGGVFLGNMELTGLAPEERARLGLAFVSGAHPVFPDLTVIENLRVAAFHSHPTQRAFKAATTGIWELIPMLKALEHSLAGVLSGGEQRMLAVAQTLYEAPTVLLADELTLGLDPKARVFVLELLRHLADEGMSVIAVDHDVQLLLSLADAAAVIVDKAVLVERPAGRILDLHRELVPAEFLVRASR